MKPLPKSRSLVVIRRKGRTICDLLDKLHVEAMARKDRRSARIIEDANHMALRMQSKLKFYAIKMGGPATLLIDDMGVTEWVSKRHYRQQVLRHKRGKNATN
jgi:hypothetical protein